MMKKYWFIILCVTVIVHNLNSQIEDSLIVHSDNEVYEYLLRSHTNNVKNLNEEAVEIYIERNLITTNDLPSIVEGIKITIVDQKSLKKLTRKKRQPFQLIRLVPLRLEENKFFATLLIFEVTCKKRSFHYTNVGGFSAYLKMEEGEIRAYF